MQSGEPCLDEFVLQGPLILARTWFDIARPCYRAVLSLSIVAPAWSAFLKGGVDRLRTRIACSMPLLNCLVWLKASAYRKGAAAAYIPSHSYNEGNRHEGSSLSYENSYEKCCECVRSAKCFGFFGGWAPFDTCYSRA